MNDNRKQQTLTIGLMILVALFFLTILFVNLAQSQTEKDLEKWRKALVWCNYHGKAKTSGFFLTKDGILVTTYHLIKSDYEQFVDGFEIYVMTHERDRVYRAKILYINKKADLLYLKIQYRPSFWFEEFGNPQEDMECRVFGFPYTWRIGKQGRIIKDLNGEWIGVDIVPFHGISGAAVLSNEGKVLMMIRAGLGYAVGTPSILIQLGLEKAREKLENE